MAEFPQRVRRAEKGPVLVSARLQTTLHFTTESGSKPSHFHGIGRLTEVDGDMIPVFGRVVTKCRLAFPFGPHSPCRRSCTVSDQFVPIRKPQEMQYPGYAGLDAEFRKINFRCDVAITEAFADQAIDWAQHSHSPQKTRMRLTSTSDSSNATAVH
jgi:hypothetical protein